MPCAEVRSTTGPKDLSCCRSRQSKSVAVISTTVLDNGLVINTCIATSDSHLLGQGRKDETSPLLVWRVWNKLRRSRQSCFINSDVTACKTRTLVIPITTRSRAPKVCMI